MVLHILASEIRAGDFVQMDGLMRVYAVDHPTPNLVVVTWMDKEETTFSPNDHVTIDRQED